VAGERTSTVLPAGCLSSFECVGYLEGRGDAPIAQMVQHHLDTCERCRVLIAETARATFGEGTPSGTLPVRALADGETLGGRYEIRRFIARGGMGEVYEAADLSLGETVALKTLSPTMLDQSDAVGRLIAEVRLARKVLHPNVCHILEFGLHRRTGESVEVIPFLTMELLDGETLASRVRREGPLDPARARQVLKELSAGLAAVHEAGIVHRDFKTENVFLVRGKDGAPERAVVMDFGLARALEVNWGSGASSTRTLVGTVAYMAPEQLEGRPATPAFDVYALGIVAFEMITGRLPFVADSPLAVATLRLRHKAPRPSSFRPGLPCVWDVVLRRCLAREPEDRFAGVADVSRTMEHILTAGFHPWVPRRGSLGRVVLAGVAGLLIATLVSEAVQAFRSGPRRDAAIERPRVVSPIERPKPVEPPQAIQTPVLPILKAQPPGTAPVPELPSHKTDDGRLVRRRAAGASRGPASSNASSTSWIPSRAPRDLPVALPENTPSAGAVPVENRRVGRRHEGGEDDLIDPFSPAASPTGPGPAR
jgi:serine/threonine protein kinase